jgi:hypothetical protein
MVRRGETLAVIASEAKQSIAAQKVWIGRGGGREADTMPASRRL